MEKKGVSLQSRFMAELSRANFPMMVGFALCQVWLSLCFFAPQLFPENSSVSVYEISLVACVVSLVPALASPKASEAWLERPWSVQAVALCASVGTLAIPFSAGSTGLDGALQVFAGLSTISSRKGDGMLPPRLSSKGGCVHASEGLFSFHGFLQGRLQDRGRRGD